MLHQNAPLGQIHVPYNWKFADAATRLAYTFVPADAGKFALQDSDASLWLVTDALNTTRMSGMPTAGDVGAEPAGAVAAHEALLDPHPQYTTAGEVTTIVEWPIAQHTALPNPHNTGISNIAGLQTALDGKAPTSHFHNQSEVTGLVAALGTKANATDVYTKAQVDTSLSTKANVGASYTKAEEDVLLGGKTDTGHLHTIANVTGLQTSLDAKANASEVYTQTQTDTLLGTKANTSHTHSIANVTGLQTALDGKTDTGHGHAITDVTNLQTTLDGKANTADVYTQTQVNTALALKADATAVYTKSETDTRIQAVIDLAPAALDTLNEIAAALGDDPNFATTMTTQFGLKADKSDTYTKAQVDTSLAGKADSSHVHSIANVTNLQTSLDAKANQATTYTKPEVDTALTAKANQATTYTKTEVDTALSGKAATVHTHTIANVTGLQTALDGKAATAHSHAIADTTGLQTALDGKAATSHVHTIANVTGLQTALDGKTNTGHTHTPAEAGADPVGTAAAAVAAHVAAADPHPTYLTQAEGDARYAQSSGELAVLASNFTTTSNTLQSTGLAVALAANTHYEIDGFFICQSSATNNGLGVGFNGPAGYLHAAFSMTVPTSATAAITMNSEGYLDSLSSTSSMAANTDFLVQVKGIVVTGATAGNLTAYLRSELSGSTARMMDHSMLKAREVA